MKITAFSTNIFYFYQLLLRTTGDIELRGCGDGASGLIFVAYYFFVIAVHNRFPVRLYLREGGSFIFVIIHRSGGVPFLFFSFFSYCIFISLSSW